MSEIKIGGHCPKCQQPIALCYCEKKFDFGQLLEDHCSVAIKKTDFDRLIDRIKELEAENDKLKEKLFSEEALKGGE